MVPDTIDLLTCKRLPKLVSAEIPEALLEFQRINSGKHIILANDQVVGQDGF